MGSTAPRPSATDDHAINDTKNDFGHGLLAGLALTVILDLGNPSPAFVVLFGTAWVSVVVVSAGLAILTIYGLAALALLTGQRQGAGRTPFRDLLCGGLLMILACLAPFAGWLMFTPFAVCTSLGAALLCLFRRNPVPPGAVEHAPQTGPGGQRCGA